MDSLNNILAHRNFDEPAEVTSIKKYIYDSYAVAVEITAREKELIITVPNAALAGTLRMQAPEIKRRCSVNDKRLVFRIG
jgi:hypothetical protein